MKEQTKLLISYYALLIVNAGMAIWMDSEEVNVPFIWMWGTVLGLLAGLVYGYKTAKY